jgi:cytochrome c553
MSHPSSIRAAALLFASLALAWAGCEQKSDPPPAAPEAERAPRPDLVATANPASPQQGAAAPAAASGTPPQAAGAPPPTAASAASTEQIVELSKPSGGPNGGMYTVKEGTKVDPNTLLGWKTWRALACDRCHGAEQQGVVGPPLVVSLHRLSKDEFKKTLIDGRPEKGMPPFNASKMVMDNMEGLYAYLKGRADAQIQPGHLYPLDSQ